MHCPDGFSTENGFAVARGCGRDGWNNTANATCTAVVNTNTSPSTNMVIVYSVGGTCVGLAALALLVVFIVYYRRRQKQQNEQQEDRSIEFFEMYEHAPVQSSVRSSVRSQIGDTKNEYMDYDHDDYEDDDQEFYRDSYYDMLGLNGDDEKNLDEDKAVNEMDPRDFENSAAITTSDETPGKLRSF